MHKTVLALTVTLLGLTSLSGWLYITNTQQRQALDLWANCPLPVKGAVLIVEADWDGQSSADTYRCSHARKSRPTLARMY